MRIAWYVFLIGSCFYFGIVNVAIAMFVLWVIFSLLCGIE